MEHPLLQERVGVRLPTLYNIGGGQPESLLDFVQIMQEELVRASVLPADFDFEVYKAEEIQNNKAEYDIKVNMPDDI